ncbi:hypothetical protein [Pseudobacillus badius]|uniref:hypothetical protein n=1 Tax=Bacillus badius TaxID=1455 RepID=UPI0007B3555B|nr:hypothetical protein [Bacillus badius]KZR57911.1 hypothetical protein A3781_19230 [Bacillus badius]
MKTNTDLNKKLRTAVESLAESNRCAIGFNPFTGELAINEIIFSKEDLDFIADNYADLDPSKFKDVIGIGAAPEKEEKPGTLDLENANGKKSATLNLSETTFDSDLLNKLVGFPGLPTVGFDTETTFPQITGIEDIINGKGFTQLKEKDEEIARLTERVSELEKQLQEEQDGLQFPEDFEFVETNDLVDDITIEEVQEIISDLENVFVPEGQFALHRIKDVAILKIHDDQGISYLVAGAGYYFANEK